MKFPTLRLWLDRSKIRLIWIFTHYTLGFLIVMSITVISCFFSVIYLSTLEKELVRTFEFEIRGQDYSQKAYTLMLSLENEVKDLLIYSDQARKAVAMGQIDRDIAELRATMRAADSRFYTRAGREILRKSLESLDDFIVGLKKLADRQMSEEAPGGQGLGLVQDRRAVLEKDLRQLIANKTANSYQGYSGLIFQLRLSLTVTIAILVITIIIRVLMYLSGRRKQADPGCPD